ncbi:MAG TPA: hypothetical protein VF077_12625 [Nitrospiraceae bacterium]
MASGDPVVVITSIMPPSANFAIFSVRVGASTPPEQFPYYSFDATTDTYLDFYCRLSGYSGGGLTFSLTWMAATATTGGVLWALAIRRLADDAEDVDVAQTYDYNEVRDVCATVSGELSYFTIPFTNGADMDNLVNNESFILRLRRRGTDNTASTGDDLAGAAQFVDLIGLET